MTEQIQENPYTFDDTSLVRESALIEAKKKAGEAKGFFRKLIDKGKEEAEKAVNPEKISGAIKRKVGEYIKRGHGHGAKRK